MSGAARVLERCDVLGGVSEEVGRLTRRFGTDAMRAAKALVAGWMREAGLATSEDAVGNLIGRRVYTDPFPAQGLITLTLTR